MTEWTPFSEREWKEIEAIGRERSELKKNYESCRPLSANGAHDLIGAAGEMLWEKKTGQLMNRNLYIGGDGGADFKDTEIKATRYRNPKYLLLWPKEIDKANKFILATIDVENRRGRFVGWAYKDDFIYESNFKLGNIEGARYYVKTEDLRDMDELWQ